MQQLLPKDARVQSRLEIIQSLNQTSGARPLLDKLGYLLRGLFFWLMSAFDLLELR